VVDCGGQRKDGSRDQRADGVESDQAGAAEHAGPDAGPLALRPQLGLGQRHLLARQLRGLVGELAGQLGHRCIRVRIVRFLLGHPSSSPDDRVRSLVTGEERIRLRTAVTAVAHDRSNQ
jgi:hypothetical protein